MDAIMVGNNNGLLEATATPRSKRYELTRATIEIAISLIQTTQPATVQE